MKTSRYYNQKFPEIDDVVMVNVRSIAEMGAYVSLLEYDNIEGMILLSELSRRRIRSINKLIRVGRNECVLVLRVDKEKGYIDLSKRRVSAEDVKKCEEKFAKGKIVNSILRHVAELKDLDLETLYQQTAWKLETKYGSSTTAYDLFKLAISEKPELFEEFDVPQDVKDVLRVQIQRRLTPQALKIRADIEVSCYTYEGIEAVKTALRAGLAVSTEAQPVKINLIAPPLYVVTTTCLDKEAGIALLTSAIEEIKKSIAEKKGDMSVVAPPRCVTETDEKELDKLMDLYGRENEEVDGDTDGDEEEEEEEAGSA